MIRSDGRAGRGCAKPVLICAFKGWNDAAESASLAVSYLADKWEAEQFATLDPEGFFDFQVNRPTVKLTEGLHSRDRVA